MSTQKPKEILHSKRSNVFYLERCRVMVKGGRVVYLTAQDNDNCYWNIPIANTSVVLLGTGTSITQSAVRMFCDAGVMFGFAGSGGTPLLSATEVEWLSPQNEYRPTEYLQAWVKFWFDDHKRLQIAKMFQHKRLDFIRLVWSRNQTLNDYAFSVEDYSIEKAIKKFENDLDRAEQVMHLLQAEARLTKDLYKFAANRTDQDGFTREHDSVDFANQFLNHGNYLAYGLAATCLWVLGVPHGLAVVHGKTRRGALVFDVADLIKDAIVLPLAFIAAEQGAKEQEFRQMCLEAFAQHAALDFMFDTVKEAARYGESLQ